MLEKFYRIIATFFGVGNAPTAPGTVASFATIPLFFIIRKLSLFWYLLFTSILAVLGIISSSKMENVWGRDPSRVVIDEVVGMLISLVSRPKRIKDVFLGFVVFRIFDIIKPSPIRNIERNTNGGTGIMLDDMIAGAFTAFVLYVKRRFS
jgi:phosphatidylglycerophosphatase A